MGETRGCISQAKNGVRSSLQRPQAKRAMTTESAERELSVVRPSERRYCTLQKWAKKGVFLVEPKVHVRPLVVTVTELASFTVDEAKRRPNKVQAAIQKTLDKAIQKAAEKPPANAVNAQPVCDARRSIPPGSHP